MPFVSDAQRKHFYANQSQGMTNGEAKETFTRMRDDAIHALSNDDYGPGRAYENEKDAYFAKDYAEEQLRNGAMPQMTEQEKIDWAAWRGDFGKK